MSIVKVKFLGTFHNIVPREELKLEIKDGATLRDLLKELEKFGEELSKHLQKLEYLVIFVNDQEYRTLKGLDTRLKEGDKIAIGHILAGGIQAELCAIVS